MESNMKNIIFISVVLILSAFSANAQQRLSVFMEQEPITTLFELIERQTGSRIFCTPGEADTLKVTINIANREPFLILSEALQETPFRVTEFGNNFFILKENNIITTLPENYYITETYNQTLGNLSYFNLLMVR